MLQSVSLFLTCCSRIAIRRWRLLVIVGILCIIPVLIVQWIMLQEQNSNYQGGWSLWESHDRLSEKLLDSWGLKQQDEVENGASGSQHRPWEGLQGSNTNKELARAASFCNMPIAMGDESEDALGPDWNLEAVYVFLRHGTRSTLTTQAFPVLAAPLNCSLHQLDSFRDSELTSFLQLLRQAETVKSGPFKNMLAYPNSRECGTGSLTSIGVLQQFALGIRLARAYPTLANRLSLSSLLIRSTNLERTYQSAHAFIRAFFLLRDVPFTHNEWSQQLEIQPATSLSFCSTEFAFSCTCPKLRLYFTEVGQQRNRLSDVDPFLLRTRHDLARFFNMYQAPAPQLSTLLDVVMSSMCGHGLRGPGSVSVETACWWVPPTAPSSPEPEPRCMPTPLVHKLWEAHDQLSTTMGKHKSQKKYAKLVMFPILSELATRMQRFNGEDRSSTDAKKDLSEREPRLALFSGHDRTLHLLLTALGLDSSHWPPFSARLVFEVFSPLSGGTKRRFRLVYNGADLTGNLVFCPQSATAASASAAIPPTTTSRDQRRAFRSSSTSFKRGRRRREKERRSTRSLGCPLEALVAYLGQEFWSEFSSQTLRKECHS